MKVMGGLKVSPSLEYLTQEKTVVHKGDFCIKQKAVGSTPILRIPLKLGDCTKPQTSDET